MDDLCLGRVSPRAPAARSVDRAGRSGAARGRNRARSLSEVVTPSPSSVMVGAAERREAGAVVDARLQQQIALGAWDRFRRW